MVYVVVSIIMMKVTEKFYDDSELEPENSLMFTITLSPFASIESPSFGN